MKYFVCSDIYGFYNEWIKALNEKGFDLTNANHICVICGDLLDRGRQPQEIINHILRHRDKFILIRGNHEDLMQDMINRNRTYGYDISNGTAQTIVDLYPEWQISEFDLHKISVKTKLQEILDSCIDYFETSHYVFVHGWIPVIEPLWYYDPKWRKANNSRWEEARWENPVDMFKFQLFEPNKTIVCGHWHCSAFWHYAYPEKYKEFGPNANFEPFITKDVIALDACTAYSKKVNVIVLEDD